MSKGPVFTPIGVSGVIAYADDSTEVSVSAQGANALLVTNPDQGNVIAVSVGWSDGNVQAVVPTSDFNGQGTIINAGWTELIRFPSAEYNMSGANIWISVAGVSVTGNAYISLGTV